jgi:hypothetical protein
VLNPKPQLPSSAVPQHLQVWLVSLLPCVTVHTQKCDVGVGRIMSVLCWCW